MGNAVSLSCKISQSLQSFVNFQAHSFVLMTGIKIKRWRLDEEKVSYRLSKCGRSTRRLLVQDRWHCTPLHGPRTHETWTDWSGPPQYRQHSRLVHRTRRLGCSNRPTNQSIKINKSIDQSINQSMVYVVSRPVTALIHSHVNSKHNIVQ